ncbi:hypothetical protein CPB86DRAFT_725314 [Serendipita vermifera]|nr:hypothetical protein CPB86DRAFT_725314 [Serendipita vermifera]
MPNKRGFGNQPRGSNRGHNQAPRGRGRGNQASFADHSQPIFNGNANATEDVLIIDFNNMGILSAMTNNSYRGRWGRGVHQHNGRGRPFTPDRGRGRGRGNLRGPGRGGYVPIPVVMPPPPRTPPPNRGKRKQKQASRGRGGGLGFIASPERPMIKNWDLATRPLLKPIKFVRAKERLFEADPDELLQAHQIPPHPDDQLDPQTERLAAAFMGQPDRTPLGGAEESNQPTPGYITEVETQETVELEEMIATQVLDGPSTQSAHVDELSIVIENADNLVIDNDRITAMETNAVTVEMEITERPSVPILETTSDLFYVDEGTIKDGEVTQPTPIYDRATNSIIGEMEEPDEIILVPSPLSHKPGSGPTFEAQNDDMKVDEPSSTAPNMTIENLSLSFSPKNGKNKSLLSYSVPRAGRSTAIPLRVRKEGKRKRRDVAWTNDLGKVFGFKDGREGLRKGDSDLDLGSESEEGEDMDNGMEVDMDLDATAMANFALRVNQPQMSAEDIEIEEAIRRHEFSSDAGCSSEEGEEEDKEADAEIEMNEAIMMEEGDYDEEDWSSDDGEDISPKASFESRLKRVRERTPGHMDDPDWVDESVERTWADKDEEFLSQIHDILDGNAELLQSRNRKERKALFRAIQTGDPDYPFATVSSRYKNVKDVPDLLAEQWARDRNKKAERKRAREQERRENGGLGNGKVKGKGKQRDIDLEEIEEMMRDLLIATGPGARKSFQLPALNKPMREKVHMMARVLNLKSTSDGKKNQQLKIMTISRTGKTGAYTINERKMDSILKRKGDKRRGGDVMKGIQEGEVIGHQAAKLDETNIGYRLLAQMGWSEGDRIGKQGGLDAPLTAVMKKTKLGLGAFKTTD